MLLPHVPADGAARCLLLATPWYAALWWKSFVRVKDCMNERTNEWITEWKKGRTNTRMKSWTNETTNESMTERKNKWTNYCIDERRKERMNEWTNQ
jgi:hypothetical protein